MNIDELIRNVSESTNEQYKAGRPIDTEIYTADKIYMDINILRDTNIGLLMCIALNNGVEVGREMYDIIKQNYTEYTTRTSDKSLRDIFAHRLNTLQTIRSTIMDKDKHNPILQLSPATKFIDDIFAHNLAVNVNHYTANPRHICIGGKKSVRHIGLSINTYPFHITGAMHRSIGEFLARRFGLEVELICEDISSMDINVVDSFDEFYVYDISRFLSNVRISRRMTEMLYLEKRIYSPNLYPETIFPEESDRIERWLNVLSTFKTFPVKVLESVSVSTQEAGDG
jgi:hypothetical protein